MSDLVERLRRGFGGLVPPVCDEAADEIERLRAEVSDITRRYDQQFMITNELLTAKP